MTGPPTGASLASSIAAVHVPFSSSSVTVGAEGVVDNRARGLALAESREVVLASEVLVGFLDAAVDIGGVHRDGDLDLVALQGLNLSFHE